MAGAQIDIGVVMQGFGVANESLGVLQQGLERLGQAGKDVRERYSALSQSLSAFSIIVRRANNDLMQHAITYENINVMLMATNKTTAATAKEFERLQKLAKLPGLELESLARGVTQLRAAGVQLSLIHI